MASLYYNPACSKCRTAQGILSDAGVEAELVRYLDAPPTVPELRALMAMLEIDDPRDMMRTGEAAYRDLELGTAGADELLEAVATHPILLERPIFVRDGRAVIARPPERVQELLTSG